jgi:hypothetical protein
MNRERERSEKTKKGKRKELEGKMGEQRREEGRGEVGKSFERDTE